MDTDALMDAAVGMRRVADDLDRAGYPTQATACRGFADHWERLAVTVVSASRSAQQAAADAAALVEGRS